MRQLPMSKQQVDNINLRVKQQAPRPTREAHLLANSLMDLEVCDGFGQAIAWQMLRKMLGDVVSWFPRAAPFVSRYKLLHSCALSSPSSAAYELFAFVSHMGANTQCGHYVAHIKKAEGKWALFNDAKVALSEDPPKDMGYLYFYKRC